MSNLSFSEKADLEALFGMKTGYVMDLRNDTFAQCIKDTVNIDIYGGKNYEPYESKARKLRRVWKNEPDNVVGTLLEALLDYYENYKKRTEGELLNCDRDKLQEMRKVAERLKRSEQVELPQKQEETLQTLTEDINIALFRNKPELVLDRLHTFSTKLIRQICIDNGIKIVGPNGKYLSLHSLVGMLKKMYENDPVFQTSFTFTAIQNSISLFEKYNDIRNSQSFAHDNPILNKMEAEFAVRIMAEVITFIDKAETYRKERLLSVSTDV